MKYSIKLIIKLTFITADKFVIDGCEMGFILVSCDVDSFSFRCFDMFDQLEPGNNAFTLIFKFAPVANLPDNKS